MGLGLTQCAIMTIPLLAWRIRADSSTPRLCTPEIEQGNIVQTKCCLLMLDLETDVNGVSQMVLEFFTVALDSIK